MAAANLSIVMKPETETPGVTRIKQSLFARLKYTREVKTEEDPTGTLNFVRIAGSRRAEMEIDGTARIEVGDYAPATTFSAQVETAQGILLWQSSDQTGAAGDTTHEFEIPDTVFDAGQTRPVATPSLVRKGRFVRLDDVLPDFSGFRFFIAPIRPAEIEGAENPQTKAVRDVLDVGGEGEVTTFEVMRIDPADLDPASLNALGFQPATIRPDGAFDFSLDIEGDEIAWLWLLLGPEDFAGYQLDALPAQPRPSAIIMLPVAEEDETGEVPEGGAGTGAEGSSGAGGSGSRAPLEFDERQLIDHPDAFPMIPASSVRHSRTRSGSSANADSSPSCAWISLRSAARDR